MSANDRQRGWPGVRAENVVLADDQALVRSGLHALLSSSDDLEVVGEARDGRDAVAVVSRTRPDVVLMDVRMPGVDGIAATRQITADPRLSGVAIIMLTTFDEDDHIFAAIRAGASGYLLKDAEPDDLRDAIRVVAAGDALLVGLSDPESDGGHRLRAPRGRRSWGLVTPASTWRYRAIPDWTYIEKRSHLSPAGSG